MMKKKITIKVDSEVVQGAERVFNTLGMDVEMAVTMFLRQTATRGELPLTVDAGMAGVPNVSPSTQPTPVAGSTNTGSHGGSDILPQASTPERSTSATTRSNNGGSITREMTDAVWRAFKHYSANGGDMSQLSHAVSKQTGMNSGSAFIYLGFLDNLVHGRYQKRNIKYSDVEIYMKYIHDELGAQPYANALESLRQTLPYWRKRKRESMLTIPMLFRNTSIRTQFERNRVRARGRSGRGIFREQ